VNAVADELLASLRKQVEAGQRAERTLETLNCRLRRVRKALGRREVQRVTADTIASLNGDLGERGYVALRRLLSFAVRRSSNAGERPTARAKEVEVLSRDDLAKLLNSADGTWRVLIATVAFSGLRQSEALALRWRDVDFENGYLRVRTQLSRGTAQRPSQLVALKTGSSLRDVILAPQLAALLKEHRVWALERGLHGDDSSGFSTSTGTAIGHRNATVASPPSRRRRSWTASASTCSGMASRRT
jgi:integrase